MREIKKYQAFDGTMWDNEKECLYHEKQDVEQMYEWAMKIRTYCKHMESCRNCPFRTEVDIRGYYCLIGSESLLPEHWEVDEFESDE